MHTQLANESAKKLLPSGPTISPLVDAELADAGRADVIDRDAVATLNELRVNASNLEEAASRDKIAEAVIKNAARLGSPPEIPLVPKLPNRLH